jgi:hemolysin III
MTKESVQQNMDHAKHITAAETVLSFGEELANALTHGFGALAIAVASPFLLVASLDHGAAFIVGAAVFVVTAVLLYLASTIYHALRPGRTKRFFQRIDHIAIFLLIAGTYTPFTLGALRGPWGWSLFGAIWGLALVGVVIKGLGTLEVCALLRSDRLSLGLYLAMGWLVLLAIGPVVRHVPTPGLLLLLCGGLAYTLGTAFYCYERIPYFHSVWHLFVLAGTAFHFAAVMNYAA